MLEDKLKKIITDAVGAQYNAGFEAGYNKRMTEEKDERTHTLQDLYRRGYKQGYEDAQAEIGEITVDDLEAI
jgi:flagellar biosynthesis/type III secretory pathway protein FliH